MIAMFSKAEFDQNRIKPETNRNTQIQKKQRHGTLRRER